MDLDHSILCGEDVARAVEVYQARRAYLISHPRLAFLASIAVLLLRCGTADGHGKQQGFNTLAYIGRVVTCHRLRQWQLNCIPRLRWKDNIEVDVGFDAWKDNNGATLARSGSIQRDSKVCARIAGFERQGIRGRRGPWG